LYVFLLFSTSIVYKFMYVPFQLAIQPHHVMAWAHGGAIKIHPKQQGHGHMVHITKSQHKRLMKSRVSGRPINIKMSPAHFKHNVRHGGGFFGDVWNKIKQGAKAAYNAVAPHVKPLLQKGIETLGNAAKERLQKEAEKIVDRGQKYIRGNGTKKRKGGQVMLYNNPVYDTGAYRIRKGAGGSQLYNNDVYNTGSYRQDAMEGGNIFDDIWSGVKTVAKVATPFADFIPGVGPIAKAAIRAVGGSGAKKKRKHKRKAAGLFPNGSHP
jgi:hypothetical protein